MARPPGRSWITGVAFAAALTLGVLVGLGGFTFGYGEGWSYFSPDPANCANCHIMNPQYDGWAKASHADVAVCNDCHLPADFVGKWMAKAVNGFNHSWAFTFQDFHEPIQMTPSNRRILQAACERCHADLLYPLLANAVEAPTCTRCHADVGHGPRLGLGR